MFMFEDLLRSIFKELLKDIYGPRRLNFIVTLNEHSGSLFLMNFERTFVSLGT